MLVYPSPGTQNVYQDILSLDDNSEMGAQVWNEVLF